MQSSLQTQNTYTKTKYPNWILFGMITIFLFLPLLITWIYAGEWNEGHHNWLVANSKLARYWMLNPATNTYGFSKNLTGTSHVSWEPFVIPLFIWIANLGLYTLTSWLKWTKVNGYNFLNGIFLLCYIAIVSGLWYPNEDNKTLVITGRVLVVSISFFVGFVISVFVVNNWVVKTSIGTEYGIELINDELNKQQYIKENIEPYKHNIAKHQKKTTVKVKDNNKSKPKSKKK